MGAVPETKLPAPLKLCATSWRDRHRPASGVAANVRMNVSVQQDMPSELTAVMP